MVDVRTSAEVVGEAVDVLNVFGGGRDDIVRTGLDPVDREIGGLLGGSVGILAADTGVGKSSLLLRACLSSPARMGVISAEDMGDVVGSRILAARSGVNSLKMRRPSERLTDGDLDTIRRTIDEDLPTDTTLWTFPPRKNIDNLRACAKALIDGGAEMLWLDYIQKFRGNGQDRRNEVGAIFTAFQEECQAGGVPGMALSQFKRRLDSRRPPYLSDIKESGDLENECRLAVLCWREGEDEDVILCRIAKSTLGGQGLRFRYRRDASGTLVEESFDEGDF